MTKRFGLVALLLGGACLTGCATHRSASLTDRFVKPGEPAIDFGGPPVAGAADLRRSAAKAELEREAKPAAAASGATVESSDPRLAAALLTELVAQTAASHVQVADEYRRLGILDAAHDRLVKAIQKAPRMAEAHELMARVWRDWGFPQNGLGPAYRAVHLDPASASARNTLGTVFDALGRRQDALIEFERASRLDPTAAWALNNQCYVAFQLGRFDRARARCEAALKLSPALAAAHNNLALTYAAGGDLARAEQEFRAAGSAAFADYNVGIVLLADQDYAAAAEKFESAIKARPAFTAAKTRAHTARARLMNGSE